LLMPAVLHKRI
uniref:Uncharacterized protein n=1 Tax=Amphimedon queenslandica TaxID=400682 RepID=A0A1X7TJ24_AMPQE